MPTIQVQSTKLTGAGAEVVPVAAIGTATHWSLYVRDDLGEAEWVKDFAIRKDAPQVAKSEALIAAAELSMQHQAAIEAII